MWVPSFRKNGDIEHGKPPLYPMMQESPDLRWAFIRKIYAILSVQLVMTVAVGSVVVAVRPIAIFFLTNPLGLAVYILISILSLLVLCLLLCMYELYPINFILLAVYTVLLSFSIGLTCAFTSGKVILEAVILTAVVVVSLTLYTFWAAKRGYDFNFLGPFLFAALMVLFVFTLIQIFFPLGKVSTMIYGGLGAIIFSGYIIYDTDNIIKRCSYDEYILAAVSLYLDIINLFLHLLDILREVDGDD